MAAFTAVCVVCSVSLIPPAIHSKHLAYNLATTQLYVMPSGTTGNADPFADPAQFTGESLVIANLMSSPELRNLVARRAGIAPSQLAVDAPVPSYLPIAAQEPTGAQRSTQIVAERDPYRLTIDATQSLPTIGITAQASNPAVARRIAAAAEPALSSYLTSVEAAASTPRDQRMVVRSAASVSVAPDSSGGLPNVAGFAFMVALALWVGLVLSVSALARDLRVLGQQRVKAGLTRKFT